MLKFVNVLFILFLVVQTTVSTVVGMEKHYDDFCLFVSFKGVFQKYHYLDGQIEIDNTQ